MKFLLEEEPEIVEPVVPSEDRAIVKLPTATGMEVPRYSEDQKEKIANDVLNGMSTYKAAEIYGVAQPTAVGYSNGKNIEDPDVKARVLSKRYEIQDVAVVKLMDTLKLLEPATMRNREKLQAVTALAGVVDKMDQKGAVAPQQVHLHLYSPNQKKESDYDSIVVADIPAIQR